MFEYEKCKTCGHPKGIHGPACWAYGLVEPKCRKHCQEFVRDNLVYLEREFLKKARQKNKKDKHKTGRYSRGNAKGLSFV